MYRFSLRPDCIHVVHECLVREAIHRGFRSRSSCRFKSRFLDTFRRGGDRCNRRMLCSTASTTGGGGEIPPGSDGSKVLQDNKLPRRLIKRLKKQGITEAQFIARLNEQDTYANQEHFIHHSYESKTTKFTRSQEELENLIKDMSVGPKYISELESFPSDMVKYKVVERRRVTSKNPDKKLHIEPLSTSVLLFPGQGSQFVGMGKKLLHFPGVNELYEEASSILGYDLLKLCLNGPKSELDKTIHCQPAVMITSIAALERLREENPEGIENCVATAGFSVGEYAALVFSGVLSFPDAIEVVKTRAVAMQRASERVGSGMLSVFLAHDSDLKTAMKMAKEYCSERQGIREPVCQVANYLFPECKVIAGHTEALNFISANAKEFRIMRTKRLPVSGAFHTKLMDSAVKPVETVLKKIKIGVPKLPVFSNLTGQPYVAKSNFVHKLCQQMVKPVKWEQIMQTIYARPQGDDFPQTFELGPSRQMGTLLKQINLQAYKSYKCIEV